MFAKLFVLILVLGATASGLLVDRQQRLDLAAEMSRTQRRLRQHEQALWRLRTEIAFATRPADARRAIERLDAKMVPIPGRLDQREQRPHSVVPSATPLDGPDMSDVSEAAHADPRPVRSGQELSR